MEEQERIIKAEIETCVVRMGHCQALINRLVGEGKPLSDRAMVDADVYYTQLGMRLVELDQQYEDYLLSTV